MSSEKEYAGKERSPGADISVAATRVAYMHCIVPAETKAQKKKEQKNANGITKKKRKRGGHAFQCML